MKHELTVLDATGDTRLAWDTDDKLSVAAANALFDRLVASGYRGVKMDTPEEGQMVKAFDPESEILMVPNIHAG